MTKYKLEYIWLDGKKPVPELRGKTQLKTFDKPPTLADLPNWGFDGSSTMQAEGKSSDCVLKPVALYPDGARKAAVTQAPQLAIDQVVGDQPGIISVVPKRRRELIPCQVTRLVKRLGHRRHIGEPLADLGRNFAAHKLRVYRAGSAMNASRRPGRQWTAPIYVTLWS